MSEGSNEVERNGVKPRLRGTLSLRSRQPEPVAVAPVPVVVEPEPVAVLPSDSGLRQAPAPLQHRVVFARMPEPVDSSTGAVHSWSYLPIGAVLFDGPLWQLKSKMARQLWCRFVVTYGPQGNRNARRVLVRVLQLDQSWAGAWRYMVLENLKRRFVPVDDIGRRFFELLPERCPVRRRKSRRCDPG